MNYRFPAVTGSLIVAVALVSGPAAAQQSTGSSMQGTQMQQGAHVKGMKVDDITGTKVVNDSGKEIGEVDHIVRDPQTDKLFAVVSVGGFLGMGEKDVVIAAQDLRWQGDRLLAPGFTEQKLKNEPKYSEDKYNKLSEDQIVSLGTTGGQNGQQMSFNQLDRNNDGFISKDEAQAANDNQLTNNWNKADQNNDQRIDRGEFAAFESMSGQQQGSGQQ